MYCVYAQQIARCTSASQGNNILLEVLPLQRRCCKYTTTRLALAAASCHEKQLIAVISANAHVYMLTLACNAGRALCQQRSGLIILSNA
jgi:hypothetical protein